MKNKNNLISKIYSFSSIEKISHELKIARLDISANTFLTRRFITTIIIFIIGLFIPRYGFIISIISSLLFYYLYKYLIITLRIKNKTKEFEQGSTSLFEILILALNNKKKLHEAIKITTNNTNGILKDEFVKTLEEVRLGKNLNDALDDMRKRIPSNSINNMISSLKLILISETNISLLNDQLERLYDKHYQNLKVKAYQVPIKILGISLFFIIPISLITLYLPYIIALID